MITIQTKPDCTLGFHYLPDGAMVQHIEALELCDHPKDIGKLSEITEEQARELVDLELDDLMFNIKNGRVKDCSGSYKLRSAALSAGIKYEDFDKYLVIKLREKKE